MKITLQKFVPALIMAVALSGAFVAGSYAFKANAAQSQVYGLYDANDVYLGDVLGIVGGLLDPEGRSKLTYTTFFPSPKGILQFSLGAGDKPIAFDNEVDVFYNLSGCQGDAYVYLESSGMPIRNPWIIKSNNSFFKAPTTSVPLMVSAASMYSSSSGECLESAAEFEGLKVKPITLPFNFNELQAPFKVKLN